MIVGRISPAAVRIVNSSSSVHPAAPQVERRLAGAVAGQLGLRAVGIEDPQLGDMVAARRARQQQDPVGADPEVRRRRSAARAPASAPRAARRAPRSRSRCPAPATSRTSSAARSLDGRSIGDDLVRDLVVAAPRAVDQLDARHLAHPGELAARVGALGALHRLDVAGEELVEPERGAGRARGARRVRGASLLRGAPRRPSRPPARRCGLPARRGRSTRPTAGSGGAAARSTALRRRAAAARCRRAGARRGERSACGRSGARRPRAPESSSACSASGPRSAISRSTWSRSSARTGGRSSMSDERGAQVEARSADHDRPAVPRQAASRSLHAPAPRSARR